MYINSLAHCPVVAHSDMFKDFLEYSDAHPNLGPFLFCFSSREVFRISSSIQTRIQICVLSFMYIYMYQQLIYQQLADVLVAQILV
jgi:hypothetical protein